MVFRVGNRMLKHADDISEYLYYLLILIETFQILWFSIHPTFRFLQDSLGLPQFQIGLRYLSLEYTLRSVGASWQVLIIVAFILVLLHFLTIAATAYLVTR